MNEKCSAREVVEVVFHQAVGGLARRAALHCSGCNDSDYTTGSSGEGIREIHASHAVVLIIMAMMKPMNEADI